MSTPHIPVKTPMEVRRMAQTSRILHQIFRELPLVIHPGTSPRQIERQIVKSIHARGAHPLLKDGFPASCCISVNEVVTHGVPSDVPLVTYDLLTVDVSIQFGGWISDAAWTYSVGERAENTDLIVAAWKVANAGVQVLRNGVSLREIAESIEKAAKTYGVRIFSDFCGHGVGRDLHEPPLIYHRWHEKGVNRRLESGMVITIEPIVTFGDPEVCEVGDGWGFRSQDRKRSAQFEHTVLIDDEGSRVLTLGGIAGTEIPSYMEACF